MQLLLVVLLLAGSALGLKSQSNTIQLRNGANTTTLIAPAGGNYTLTLPASAGSSGQALTTNGSGTLSWSAVASSIDGLSDAKSGGTGFSNSLILGHQTTGTLVSSDGAEYNTAVGYESLKSITTGKRNTAIGYSTLSAATIGGDNIAIGVDVLASLTSGGNNIAIGTRAGQFVSIASENTIIGWQDTPSFGAVLGAGNTAVGAYGQNDAEGSYNVTVGWQSGFTLTSTSEKNVGIGYANYRDASSGDNNVAIGNSAMYKGGSGSNNVAIGLTALRYLTSSANNVAVGTQSMYNATTGSNNTTLGYNTGYGLKSGSNNVFIGYNAGSNTASDASDLLYIDNSNTNSPLIYGDFSGNTLTFNGATTTTGTSAINGVVSIGGTTAAAGEIRLLEDLDDGAHYTAFKAQAQVANVTYTLPAADGTGGFLLKTDGSGNLSWTNDLPKWSRHKALGGGQGAEFYIEDSGGNADWVFDQEGDGSNPRLRIFNNLETNGIAIEDAGNVGIGIGDPTERLHVSGNILATGVITSNDNRIRIATAKTPASATDTGTTGEICWDANYIYICTATNTWKRVAIATW